MNKKTFLLLVTVITSIGAYAQTNFTVVPAKPKPGDLITISYTPAGDIANTTNKVEGIVITNGSKSRKADDLLLVKKGKKYTATIQTDTSHNFIQLGFYSGDRYDNNYNEGYYIQLYQGDKIRKGSYASLGLFYMQFGQQTRVAKDNLKVLSAFEKEFELYPDQKLTWGVNYFFVVNQEKKAEASALIQKEIEATLKAGLTSENSYAYLSNLYGIIRLSEQSKFINTLRKKEFPQGTWVINQAMEDLYKETDPKKKEEILATIEQNVRTKPEWKVQEKMLPTFRSMVLNQYAAKKQWDDVQRVAATLPDKGTLASVYNNAAWGMQEKNEDIAKAAELSQFATEYARQEWKKPSGVRPDYVTAKDWEKQRESTYAMYADTYAMVLYRKGEYAKGYEFTKEAALTIQKGNDADQNNTYALLAQKVLPEKELKADLEKFVKDGKATSGIKEILKEIYVKEKGTEAGFDNYVSALEKEAYLKMVEELKKSILNESTPAFALKDLNGNLVNISDLKGKVVILDFWATWCGPCLASFPGMQKMVTKYKDDPSVKFIFVDTWERGDTKEKNAQDFITTNKYSFQVLMDNDNKVVEQFKIEGIPTKFVIDKEGKIRFKSVGFGGSDDKLISELTVMIEMASNPI